MDILKSSQLVIFSHSTIFITFSYRSLAGFLFKLLRSSRRRKPEVALDFCVWQLCDQDHKLRLSYPRQSLVLRPFAKCAYSLDVIIEVSVPSDKRPHRILTFHKVLARQRSSFCNRARLNFRTFALRDTKVAAQEGCRVGQKMSYHFSFC